MLCATMTRVARCRRQRQTWEQDDDWPPPILTICQVYQTRSGKSAATAPSSEVKKSVVQSTGVKKRDMGNLSSAKSPPKKSKPMVSVPPAEPAAPPAVPRLSGLTGPARVAHAG